MWGQPRPAVRRSASSAAYLVGVSAAKVKGHHRAGHDHRREPPVIPRQTRRRQTHPARDQCLLFSANKFEEIHHPPNEPRQIKRLPHGRCLHVNQIRIQTVNRSRRPTRDSRCCIRLSAASQNSTHQPENSDNAENISHHRRNRSPHATPPQIIGNQKRNHQQMRQRKPHRPQLQQPRSPGIKHAPRDVDMCHRIAIEHQVPASQIEQERKDRNEDCEEGQQPDLIVPARAGWRVDNCRRAFHG